MSQFFMYKIMQVTGGPELNVPFLSESTKFLN